jgi:enoyl-CoA hydratase
MTVEPEVIFSVEGKAGVITLNRPQVLNALTYNMVQQMDAQLIAWAADSAIEAVMITGAGDRAFCSGGDIKSVALAIKKGGPEAAVMADFFRVEYTLNHRIFTFPKPYISLINGIVMGGGKGVSAHGSHRIVTENTTFAMPETGIGFFPDVGGGYFLPRCPGETGTYLALTSKRIKTFDTLYIGFATHFVPAVKISALRAAIAKAPQDISTVLQTFSALPPGDSEIAPHREKIDRYFAHDHVEEIMADLEKDSSSWAAETLKTMNALSPSSLKIALQQIRRGAKMNFAEVMTMEYRLSQACLQRPDFYEGVRAALIDKDRNPQWNPSTVRDVPDADINACFQSLGTQDLVL